MFLEELVKYIPAERLNMLFAKCRYYSKIYKEWHGKK